MSLLDRYGRTIGEVSLPDGRVLNRELVKAGFAWWYRRYAPEDVRLEQLENEAREAGRGLWADAEPVPPWEWRTLGLHRPTHAHSARVHGQVSQMLLQPQSLPTADANELQPQQRGLGPTDDRQFDLQRGLFGGQVEKEVKVGACPYSLGRSYRAA